MANRISVSAPQTGEESRQLAEAVADLHYVVGIIVEHAKEFIPGEAVDEITQAWEKSQGSMRNLIAELDPSPPSPPPPPLPPTRILPPINHDTLSAGELTGDVGRIKKSMLSRLKDRFFMFWNSEPRTVEKIAKAAEAACDYFEAWSTIMSSIPGHEQVVEFLSVMNQLINIRAKRGV